MWTVEEVATIVCRGVSAHRVTRNDGVITVTYVNGQTFTITVEEGS